MREIRLSTISNSLNTHANTKHLLAIAQSSSSVAITAILATTTGISLLASAEAFSLSSAFVKPGFALAGRSRAFMRLRGGSRPWRNIPLEEGETCFFRTPAGK
jgi:hypothetical protein